MKKTLENLRSRPHHVRVVLMFVFAGIMTAFIVVGWVMTFTGSRTVKKQSSAPSPVNAMAGSIKNVLQSNKKSNVDIKIINTSSDEVHDETNPYQQ